MKNYIDRGPYYDNLNIEEREACYNGMGAEWMDDRIRAILDKTFDEFEEPVQIHDIGYTYGNTPEDKIEEDKRLFWNCIKAAWNEIGIWNAPKMLRFFGYARIMYLAVKLAGDKAFWDGKTKPYEMRINEITK